MNDKTSLDESQDTVFMLGYQNGAQRFIERPRPKDRPRDCGRSNEDLECLGCGEKLGCIAAGRCALVDGAAAYKSRKT